MSEPSTALALAEVTSLATMPTREEAEATATAMAREYREATAEITQAVQILKEQCNRLFRAFQDPAEKYPSNHFQIDLEYYSSRTYNLDGLDRIFKGMKRQAWECLVNKLGIKNIMSVKRRKEFESQLESGDLPEITEDAILGLLFGLADQAKDFATEAAKEVFDILRPRGHWGGQYKTNDAFRVGRRVILSSYVESSYGGPGRFRVNYHYEQHLTAIDAIFHLLDGKGVLKERRSPLYQAIETAEGGKGETEYFRFKCFKNRNLHLEFKRLDLVKQLNGLAAGEYVLGEDEATVA